MVGIEGAGVLLLEVFKEDRLAQEQVLVLVDCGGRLGVGEIVGLFLEGDEEVALGGCFRLQEIVQDSYLSEVPITLGFFQ